MNDIIRERYPFEPTKKIADDLGVTVKSVYDRASTMGIKKILNILGLLNFLQDI
jgi:hypothetical protein